MPPTAIAALWIVGLATVRAADIATTARAQTKEEPSDPGRKPEKARDQSQQLAEVIVTATKRRERIQDVPVSITAFTGPQLSAMGAVSFVDYAREVPGLSFAERGDGRNDITIRGLSVITGSPTVAYYLDGISTELNFQSPDPVLYDIERVEVLKGPQGTLYGDGAVGGLINIITNPPDPSGFDASALLDWYSIDHAAPSYGVNGMINIPLVSDKLALRLVAVTRDSSGWIDAPLLGREGANWDREKGVRASLRWIAGDSFEATLREYYQQYHIGMESFETPSQALAAGYSSKDVSLVSVPSLSTYEANQWSLDLRWNLGFAALESVSGYNRTLVFDQPDGLTFSDGSLSPYAPATQYSFPLHQPYKTYTSELRLVSSGAGRWQYTTGLYWKKMNEDETANLPLFGESVYFAPSDRLFAIYGQLGYKFTDAWTLTAGARYVWERVTANTVTSIVGVGSATSGGGGPENAFSPKLTLQYKASQNVMYYASASKGIRSGGVNVEIVPSPYYQPTYKSDSAWDYEIGTKSLWNDRHTELNADVYYIKWSHLQIDGLPSNPALGFVTNAGDATSKGFEADFEQLLSHGLKITLGGAYIDATIDEALMGAPAGSRMPNVPRYTADVGLVEEFPISNNLQGDLRADFNYRDGSYSNLPNVPLSEPNSDYASGYGLINLRATVTAAHWNLSVYADNLTNRIGTSFAQYSTTGLDQIYMTRPRTVGVEFGVNLK